MSRINKYKGNSQKLEQRKLQYEIVKLLGRKIGKFYSAGVISAKLKTKNSKDSVKSALEILKKKDLVSVDLEGRYAVMPDQVARGVKSKKIQIEGVVDMIASGSAYILVANMERDVYVPKKYLNGALHRDTVRIETSKNSDNRRPEGRILEVVRRHRTSFAGVFQNFTKYGFVFVQENSNILEVKILPADFNEATNGDLVIVNIKDFGTTHRHELIGEITTVLGQQDQNEFEMNSILINNGFNIAFPAVVQAEAARLEGQITEDDLVQREDYRDVLTFTIDPVDAKDFDDAISYQVLPSGELEIGVHIADVTHFVLPGSELDKEAFKRSTSVYLVDRVCPMLPEKISNELCSLRPNEDKLCFSAIFTFDKKHMVKKEWFGKTLIHSDRRFTYEEAQEIIENGEGEYAHELKTLNELAKVLKKKRFESGSVDFDSDEVRFVLDANKKPIEIIKKVRQDANKLIEEFMLLANKSVAKFISHKDKIEIPNVYRIHDLPDEEKLNDLALLANELGIKLNVSTPAKVKQSLNSIDSSSLSEDLKKILKSMAIRSMAKAAYSSDNIGHFGLGFDHYSHFTSPIRRYADILTHRILYANLNGIHRVTKTELEERCKYISIKERDAINAERDSVRYKQVEYMSTRIGEVFKGVIRNIIGRGMFVEINDIQCDGLVSFASMDETVTLDPSNIKLSGDSSGKVWRIGDEVSIEVLQADLLNKQLEFGLVTEE